MIGDETIDVASTIRLQEALEAAYPLLAIIHVFLENAKYHHATLVQEWLAQPGRRIKLHFIPAYCPNLNPIERLGGVFFPAENPWGQSAVPIHYGRTTTHGSVPF